MKRLELSKGLHYAIASVLFMGIAYSQNSQDAAVQRISVSNSPEIKGLYIGMPQNDAMEALRGLSPNSNTKGAADTCGASVLDPSRMAQGLAPRIPGSGASMDLNRAINIYTRGIDEIAICRNATYFGERLASGIQANFADGKLVGVLINSMGINGSRFSEYVGAMSEVYGVKLLLEPDTSQWNGLPPRAVQVPYKPIILVGPGGEELEMGGLERDFSIYLTEPNALRDSRSEAHTRTMEEFIRKRQLEQSNQKKSDL